MQPVRRVQADVSEGQCDELGPAVRALAKPINSSAMSRRADTPAGQSPTRSAIDVITVRISANSKGDRRSGRTDLIRRTPDNARRTTSARPGASSPAAVWNWLIDDTHLVNVAGVYCHWPAPVCSDAASVTLCATTRAGAGNGTKPRSEVHEVNLAQSDR